MIISGAERQSMDDNVSALMIALADSLVPAQNIRKNQN
jgi:hypothetical protein